MKIFALLLILFPMLSVSFYDLKINSLEGKTIDFSQYKGKTLLIVNTASECGYTPQYSDLQELHEKFRDKVTILGFPANNFGGQEPGSNSQILPSAKRITELRFRCLKRFQ